MIQQFLSRIKMLGLAQPTRWIVLITPPAGRVVGQTEVTIGGQQVLANLIRSNFAGDVARELALMAESAVIPGKSLTTTDRHIYGPTYKAAYGQMYNEMPMVFNVDNKMFPKTLFTSWMDLAIDPNTNDVEYYKNYVTDIELHQLDRANNVIYKVKLHEAFPTTVNDMTLDYGALNTTHKLSVSFAFRKWSELK